MAEFIRRRHVEHVAEYRLFFERKSERGSGFSYECDKDGNVFVDKLHPCARAGYEELRTTTSWQETFHPPYVEEIPRIIVHYAAIRCRCRREVVLSGNYESECECGQLYNLYGQALAPREQWGEETGETYSDIVVGSRFDY